MLVVTSRYCVSLETAEDVHGNDGMGDIGLPLHGRQPASGHAVDVLRSDDPGKRRRYHAWSPWARLTNVALALLLEPDLAECVEHCYIMGGIGAGHGNVTPTAEFNIWVDPEAARIVYESGMPITMVGWDISWKYATFDAEQAADIRGIGTPLSQFVVDIQSTLTEHAISESQLPGFDLPDPITMAAAIDPSIAEYRDYRVDVTTGDGSGTWHYRCRYLGHDRQSTADSRGHQRQSRGFRRHAQAIGHVIELQLSYS